MIHMGAPTQLLPRKRVVRREDENPYPWNPWFPLFSFKDLNHG